jgi:hypothetical protein
MLGRGVCFAGWNVLDKRRVICCANNCRNQIQLQRMAVLLQRAVLSRPNGGPYNS